ncbi:putative membrane protein YccC [Variovorax boronicumulans]|uniref:Membrane protein YccC n=1 Tax=Variovorax boronicumulans TaxID=436515 RepID=A0AAW8CTQ3_9BURK|nr:FUSC family membrane protein [Variovorax boronicumulans]MDP9892292.1 putative membrane protein YccC [Variovorax boronicumulans]MDQ0052229.1 putative membrane protein YccC [Variovorax boronicumulans]
MLPLSSDALRQRLRSFASRAQPLRILLTLGSLMAVCGYTGHTDAVIPLFLGAIASALAETDDSWRGRFRAQLVTLACFAVLSFSVEALFGRPVLFIAGLAFAAFWLTMLGAVEARYKAIAYATLILAMYATLGIENQGAHGHDRGREPLLLLAGAGWYGVFSVLWCAAFPAQPVQARLVTLFTVLGNFVRFKASLFEPLRGIDIEQKRLSLAQLNAEVVSELNAAKESIFRRIGARAPTGRISRYRGLYLIAQDVHERASSSHDDYNALADAFFHSDLLYRCQRVLGLQGLACQRLASSIARREPFEVGEETVQALADLRGAIDGQLAGASQPSARAGRTEMGLFNRSPRSWRDAVERVRRQLTPRSPLFRHALRLAIALAVGYGVMHVIHPAQGYWILLTTLFVCQQSFGDTVSRMGQRIAGTALGVVAGWALLQLFPQPLVQSVIAVVAGVLFFATRATRYLLATAAMTLLVLMCFNQVGDSGLLLVPRLVDTAIGSAIAGLAVLLVLPHWQARRINELAATAMRSHAGYLRRIVEQYGTGPRDHLDYRLARRNDHNADAALSTAVSDMFREPGYVRPRAGIALRFLIRSHTLLSYLSALGAHRAALPDSPHMAVLRDAAEAAAAALDALAGGLQGGAIRDDPATEPAVRAALAAAVAPAGDAGAAERTIHTELALVWLQIDALRTHAREWLQPGDDAAPATLET